MNTSKQAILKTIAVTVFCLTLLMSSQSAHAQPTPAPNPCLLQTFQPPRHFSNGSTTVRVAIADFNNDGNPDIAATAHAAGYVGIFLGDGTGNFSGPTILSAGNFDVPV